MLWDHSKKKVKLTILYFLVQFKCSPSAVLSDVANNLYINPFFSIITLIKYDKHNNNFNCCSLGLTGWGLSNAILFTNTPSADFIDSDCNIELVFVLPNRLLFFNSFLWSGSARLRLSIFWTAPSASLFDSDHSPLSPPFNSKPH